MHKKNPGALIYGGAIRGHVGAVGKMKKAVMARYGSTEVGITAIVGIGAPPIVVTWTEQTETPCLTLFSKL